MIGSGFSVACRSVSFGSIEIESKEPDHTASLPQDHAFSLHPFVFDVAVHASHLHDGRGGWSRWLVSQGSSSNALPGQPARHEERAESLDEQLQRLP